MLHPRRRLVQPVSEPLSLKRAVHSIFRKDIWRPALEHWT